MTKVQCYSEISRNEQLIKGYEGQIDTLDKELEELTDTQNKVANMKDTLSSCKQTSVMKLSDTGEVNKINSKIVNNFFEKMTHLFSGTEYTDVYQGLKNGIEKIQDEIRKRKKQISELKTQIVDCEGSITQMKSAISQIEAEERAQAEAQAAEDTTKQKK